MNTIDEAVMKYFDDCKKGCSNLIASKDLYEAIQKKEKLFMLDIRRPEDFAKNQINGSINIYWSEVGEFIDVLPMDEKIIVICYTGQTSGQVVSLLKVLGYDAYSLSGGMINGWMKGSLPVQAGCST
ncbi:rhodanese-like domain-containing protein [Marinisporobacter balticus]|uniref:Rhodanese-related sulfurtransferase n=1 Tax=Marinisporobacter balticus TaxID=2018667 RepID=A0A4R2KX55_9FIRM|nr:rhodanese-like domain-containing protein [Marinisporobacter balticus]TCO74818.1 rhodanese-related sulfurtransferase [Marinisporobacter balticus]